MLPSCLRRGEYIECETTADNAASLAVQRKLGFVPYTCMTLADGVRLEISLLWRGDEKIKIDLLPEE